MTFTESERVSVNWGGKICAGTFLRYRTEAERAEWREHDDVMVKLDNDTVPSVVTGADHDMDVPFRVFESAQCRSELPGYPHADPIRIKAFGIQSCKPTPNGNLYSDYVLRDIVSQVKGASPAMPVCVGDPENPPIMSNDNLVAFAKDAEFDGRHLFFLVTPCLGDHWTNLILNLQGPNIRLAFNAVGKSRIDRRDGKIIRVVEEAALKSLIVVNQDGEAIFGKDNP